MTDKEFIVADIEAHNKWFKEHRLLEEALNENNRLRKIISLYEKYVALLEALEELGAEE